MRMSYGGMHLQVVFRVNWAFGENNRLRVRTMCSFWDGMDLGRSATSFEQSSCPVLIIERPTLNVVS